MTLKAIKTQFAKAGSHLTDGDLKAILAELQGLTTNVVAGAASSVKINLAAIRKEDTVLSAIEYVTGVPTDRTSLTTISETRAVGTVTAAAVLNNDTVTVRGLVYTFKTTVTNLQTGVGTAAYEVAIGANNTESALNLATAINNRDGSNVTAVAAAAVVTVTAVVDGTAGNAYTLASSNGIRLAVSAATLAGGTATGGIAIAAVTTGNSIVVTWFNKQ